MYPELINNTHMKGIKKILLGLLLITGLFLNAQDTTITYKFNEYKVVAGTPKDTLIFIVEAKANVPGTYLWGSQIVLNFNNAVFGTNIATSVIVMKTGILQPYAYTILKTNTGGGTQLLINIIQTPPVTIANLASVPTAFTGVVKVKMLIDNPAAGNVGVNFHAALMDPPRQKYVLPIHEGQNYSGTPYDAVTYANNLTDLPTTPTVFNLLFSELGDPSDAGTSFVEIYNAGAQVAHLTPYNWYLNVDGSSSVQLTGSLAAGAAQVVPVTGATPGTAQYLLSLYGDYSNGTAIDFYDGGLAGFDFTGKHAVRHYNITNPNLVPTLAEWVISPAENIDMTPGSHRATVNWVGVTAPWRLQGNWAEGLIPDAAHNVVIPNTGTAPLVGYGMNAYAHDLAIGSAGLVIESHETNGDGSLITFGNVTGTASVQRFLGADRYWYISQPVTSAAAGVFLHIWMFTYNEATGSWSPFIEDPGTPLNLMQGYAVWTSSTNSWYPGVIPPIGDTTVAYEGTLNTGSLSTPLTSVTDGWNFLGNPYPSSVDWDAAGWTKTNLTTNAYYVWNAGSYATYSTGGGGSNTATQYIPAAQGFFVNANASGTLGVSNAVRAHSTQTFWKNRENMLNRLSMTITNGNVNDETVIYFHESATAELDYDFDAFKLMAESAPQAYTMLGEEKMAINTFNNPVQTPSVNLGINAPETGEYTITASNIESFDATTPIYLEDLANGTIVNLRETSTYTFTADEGPSGRFLVHFTAVQGIGDEPASETISIYAANRYIYVNCNSHYGEISVFNILGQEVGRQTASGGLNKLAVPYGNAVYIVKVISENSTVTKKVFVK